MAYTTELTGLQHYAIVDGVLTGARQHPSPNFNARPNSEVSLLVIHNISLPAGCFNLPHIEALFINQLDCDLDPTFEDLRGVELSAHLLIRRDGEVVQFVNFEQRAWHAGVSNFNGRINCNDFSIGIELEGTDNTSYTDAQYKTLIAVTKVLCKHYPLIGVNGIVGHCDIAPARKSDPGIAFDWQRYRQSLT